MWVQRKRVVLDGVASGWPDVEKTCSLLFATREENDVTSVEEGVLPSTGRRDSEGSRNNYNFQSPLIRTW